MKSYKGLNKDFMLKKPLFVRIMLILLIIAADVCGAIPFLYRQMERKWDTDPIYASIDRYSGYPSSEPYDICGSDSIICDLSFCT